ncbi:MAG: hypothetical protein ACRYFS_23270 [Janthinobacterium lividum]
MTTQTTRSALLLLAAGGTALLAGCGGGGSNGNLGSSTTGTTGTTGTTTTGTSTGTNNTSQIVGKVTDVNGTGVSGVSIAVDTGGQITTTISTGGYRLNNLTGNVAHTITASVTQNAIQYTGSTQVFTSPGNLVSNANILLSPTSQQATVKGTVTDSTGSPIAGASVYLAVPNVALAGTSGTYSSLVAFTDSTGFYQIKNVPSSLPAGSLKMTAAASTTTTAYQNSNATLAQNTITPGSVSTQNFTLTASSGTVADVPVVQSINAFTQPTDGLTGSALQARLATGTVYEGLRRKLSPSYASFVSRKRSYGKRLTSRAVSGSYAVETDLAFTPPSATDTNLLGYYIYQTTGSVTTNPPTEAKSGTSADFYDSLLDPLANYYTDLTASTDASSFSYAGGSTYNFAISSIAPAPAGGTTNILESALSAPITITPLSPLTLSVPAVNATVTTPVTLTWTPVAGATKYYVFIYTQYPTIDTTPIYQSSTPLAAGTSTTSVVLTGGSVTYYAVVVGTADETETVGATTPVVNAAQTYSEITQFIVQ